MEAPPLERKLAAILAADFEGYSRLMHADEEHTLATLTAHRSIVDDLIVRVRGQIFEQLATACWPSFRASWMPLRVRSPSSRR